LNIITGKKIVVTGGAGFIGSNLCEALLNNDNEVICLDNFLTGKRENISEFLENKKFKLFEADIRNIDDCKKITEGVDIVFHQAALGSVPRSIENPATTNEININGFLNILIACKENKIKRLIYASSSSVYGDHPDLPKVEENIGKPLSPYAVTKQVNEMYAKVFSDLYGMEIIGLRYFNVFGKKQDPEGPYAAAIPKFIKLLMKGESPVIYGDGSQSRDFTYVDNVVSANLLAASSTNKDALGNIFNIACGQKTTLNELCSILVELLLKQNIDIKKSKPSYAPERRGDIRDSLASITKAKNILGYIPDSNVKKGLEKSINWYVNNLI
jgi:UDP-N-acetylglucosamine 4-epimerase